MRINNTLDYQTARAIERESFDHLMFNAEEDCVSPEQEERDSQQVHLLPALREGSFAESAAAITNRARFEALLHQLGEPITI